jgi:predicted metalloprotease
MKCRRKSDNLEDRQGMSSGGKTIVGGGLIRCYFTSECFGGENGQMVGNILEQTQGKQKRSHRTDLTEQELEEQDFINAILVDNEDVWTKIFKKII